MPNVYVKGHLSLKLLSSHEDTHTPDQALYLDH